MDNSAKLWLSQLPSPTHDGHKYDRGHALIFGGEVLAGATRLAARAAQRMGAGLVTLAAPDKAYELYASSLESVMVRKYACMQDVHELLSDQKKNAVLAGPGLGIDNLQKQLVLDCVASGKTCVLDADALTSFSGHPETLLKALHPNCVLTPHEGEFVKLFGALSGMKIERATQAAKITNCIVLLKGAETVIAKPDGNVVSNHHAPPWLATAGAGDVLAGIILGLAAQKMPLFEAACAAAWIHGEVAQRFGLGLIAEDLVAGIPAVLQHLSSGPSSLNV